MRKVALFFLTSSLLWAMQLKEVLVQVERQNLEIQKFLIDEKVASLKHEESKWSRFGSIKLGAGYTHYNSPRTLAPMTPPVDPNTPTDKQIYNANLSYRVVLFDGFGTKHSIAIEELGIKMANLRTNQTKWSLRSNAISLYVAGLALQEMLPIQKEYVSALSQIESIIKEEERLGRRAYVDLLQISTEKMQAQTQEVAIKSDLSHVKLEIARLMSSDDKSFIFEPIQDVAISNTQFTSIENTSSMQIANLNIERTQKVYQKTKASFSPKFTLETLYSRNYGDNTHENTYQAGIGVEWVAFDFGVRNKRLEEARLERLKAVYEKKDIYEKLITAIEQAKLKIAKAQEEHILARQKSTLASHIEKIEAKKLKEGATTMQSFLLHAADAHFAKVQKHNAFYSLVDAKYQYFTLLEIEK
ncbi:MAG: TolC family protein [Campylobacteraceae bacterium]|nr:TolC family protein [Campylobacteraceae bacterium]